MVVVSATAAVGGLVALTGSLVSYAVARARGSKREHKLKGDSHTLTRSAQAASVLSTSPHQHT
jgi:hypothetical protein